MPEGPEIKIMTDELSEELKGKHCSKLTVHSNSRYYNSELFHSDYVLKSKDDKKVFKINCLSKGVVSFGKKIVFKFKGGLRFVNSPLLDGRWHLNKVDNYCITIEYDEGKKIYYSDKSNGGLFSIVDKDSNEYDHIFKGVGPNLMTFEVKFKEYWAKISRNGIKNKQVQDFLMDQKEFSGVGNYLKSEVLYLSGISPMTLCGDLSEKRAKKLFKRIISTMELSYSSGGATIESFVSPKGNYGKYRFLCYKRDETDDGEKIEVTLDKNKRKTYYSPDSQN